MSNNDRILEIILNKILKFNKEISTNQNKIQKNRKKTLTKSVAKKDSVAIKKIEDDLINSSAKFLLQKNILLDNSSGVKINNMD
jgi:hypothetical protein